LRILQADLATWAKVVKDAGVTLNRLAQPDGALTASRIIGMSRFSGDDVARRRSLTISVGADLSQGKETMPKSCSQCGAQLSVPPASRLRKARAILVAGKAALPARIATRRWRWAMLPAALCLLGTSTPLGAQDIALDALVRAYPDALTTHDSKTLTWKDGTSMPVSDGRSGKSFEDKLRHASILDQFSIPYVAGPPAKPPGPQEDPGRFRNTAFFDKMYGDCSRGEVQKKLTKVAWLPKSGGGSVQMTSVNGVADRLRAVSAELDALPAELKKFAFPSAGTFNCRVVKDTGVRSMHAWGAAIDINTKFSDYWLWSRGGPYRNRVPVEIVQIFEKHGFIWGGKWGHFDTMHFEYRPELLHAVAN